MQLIQAFEQLVSQAIAERARAAARVAEVERLLADAKRCRADRDAARVRLADALEVATVAADAAATRLGAVRGSVADAARQLEEAADLAAGDDQGATRQLAKLSDALATQRELQAAHERRAAVLADAQGEAERALAEHDAAEVDVVGRELEQIMLAAAAEVDGLLETVTERVAATFEVMDRRRQLHPREAWAITFLHTSGRFSIVQAAFERATWSINHARVAIGSTTAQSFASSILSAVQSWQRGRGEVAPKSDQAA